MVANKLRKWPQKSIKNYPASKYLRLEQHKVKQEGEEVVSGSDGCQHIRQFGLATEAGMFEAGLAQGVVWQFL